MFPLINLAYPSSSTAFQNKVKLVFQIYALLEAPRNFCSEFRHMVTSHINDRAQHTARVVIFPI